MTESPTKKAWDAYQAAAARDPFSDETKKKRAAYQRALTIANKKARST